jgi:subtilisin family serine protease
MTPWCVAGPDDGMPLPPSHPERNGTISTNPAPHPRRPGNRTGLAHRPHRSADATNRVIVQFKSGLSRQDMDRLLASVPSVVSVSPDRFHSDRFLVVTSGADPDADTDRLAQLPGVAWAERDERVMREARFFPSDTFFTNQWYLCNTGQGGALTNRDISADRAWDITQGTSSVVIAILDDGVDMTHPDLTNNVFINVGEYGGGRQTNGVDDDHDGYIDDWRGWDFIATNNDPSPKLAGDNHGTAMAGVVAATMNNGIGIAGIAGQCRFLPIRVLGSSASDSDWANAIEYAARFADVIVVGAYFPPVNVVYDALDYALINGRGGKGCVICAALGNNGVRRRYSSDAAAAPEVLTVSGASCFDKRSWFADYGPALNLVAPAGGGAIDLDSQALVTTDRLGPAGYTNADYIHVEGTSFACALAGGTAALVISKNPSLTGLEVRRILEMSCDKVDAEACPYDSRGWNEQYGVGRLNAWAALTTPLPAPWDAYEPDDSPAQAAPLRDGELQYRSLESGSSADWAQFAVTNTSADVLISVLGTTNTWLRLFNSATNLVAQDNRGYPSYSYIQTNLVNGSYFVSVESPSAVPIPEYGLHLELRNMPDEYEHDNFSAAATTIVPRQMQFHTLYPTGDVDWATFTLTTNTHVEIRTMGEWTGFLELSVWSTNSRIGYNYNTNVTTHFSGQLPPATYWICVDDHDGWSLPSYQLLLETYDADPYEGDNTNITAKTIHSGERLTHTIYPAYDTDWLKFSLTDTSSVLVLTDSTDPMINDASCDTVLKLYRAATGLVFVASNDDGNHRYFSAISRANLDPGDYYIEVAGFSNVVCQNFYVSLDVLPSRVSLSSLTQQTNGYELSWSGDASFNYKVQYASNLVGTQVWTTATNLEGVIGTNRWLDNGAVSNMVTPYFYRIVTE